MTYHKSVGPSCTHTFIFVHSGSYIFLIQIKDVVFLILTAEPVSFFRSCFFFPVTLFLEIFVSCGHVFVEARNNAKKQYATPKQLDFGKKKM